MSDWTSDAETAALTLGSVWRTFLLLKLEGSEPSELYLSIHQSIVKHKVSGSLYSSAPGAGSSSGSGSGWVQQAVAGPSEPDSAGQEHTGR